MAGRAVWPEFPAAASTALLPGMESAWRSDWQPDAEPRGGPADPRGECKCSLLDATVVFVSHPKLTQAPAFNKGTSPHLTDLILFQSYGPTPVIKQL